MFELPQTHSVLHESVEMLSVLMSCEGDEGVVKHLIKVKVPDYQWIVSTSSLRLKVSYHAEVTS